jgi:hypothetical protein
MRHYLKNKLKPKGERHQWLMPVILATQEAEMRILRHFLEKNSSQ